MNKRVFAIINLSNYKNIIKNIINNLNTSNEIFIFCKEDNYSNLQDTLSNSNIHIEVLPENILYSSSKTKNHVFKYFKEKNNNFKYLHLFEDSIEIINDMTKFFDDIEEMMLKLGLNSWFNTRCDPCNYVMTKYDPRIRVVIDNEKLALIYDKTIYWTSHANTLYSIYDLENISLDQMLFDERFSIPMFYIIKKFADRRNDVNDPFPFMNFYPTIDEEGHLFKVNNEDDKNNKDKNISQDTFRKENELFKTLNIDYHPDVNVEAVLDFMNDRLLEYARKNGQIL